MSITHQRREPDLFDMPAQDVTAHRHRGNQESRAAFAGIALTLTDRQADVLHRIRETGDQGTTCKELAASMGVGMNVISGRFSELKRDGKLTLAGRRDGCAAWKAMEA